MNCIGMEKSELDDHGIWNKIVLIDLDYETKTQEKCVTDYVLIFISTFKGAASSTLEEFRYYFFFRLTETYRNTKVITIHRE